MKRVLYVNHEVELGGAERSLLDLITGLRRDRFEVHLACSKPGPLAEAAGRLGATVHDVPMLFAGKLRKLFGLFRAGLRLRKLIRAHGIDIVHTNTLIAGYCGSLGARLAGIPCVWHVRDLDYPEAAKSVVARVDLILANSQATASTLRNGRDLGDKLKIVYNAVPDSFFDQTPAGDAVRRELALPADESLVGMVGRLDPQKGHLEFLDAAKQVLVKRDDVTFLIVGGVLFDGARQRLERYQEQLETHARRIGIFGKVRFLGQREDVPRLLAAMDV
ncbi:MAG: glycosyltransferase, partial [Planctomycetota bacterium]